MIYTLQKEKNETKIDSKTAMWSGFVGYFAETATDVEINVILELNKNINEIYTAFV